MNKNSDARSGPRKERSRVLLTLTTVYGILYLVLIISSLFERPDDAGMTLMYIAFLVFLVGYYYSWRNELVAGIVFIFWWGIMWYLGLFVAEHDRGAGVVMGIPLFILALLFIVSWYRTKGQEVTAV